MAKRGYYEMLEAQARLGMTREQVIAEGRAGRLILDNSLNPQEVARASVAQYLHSTHHRIGAFAQGLILIGQGRAKYECVAPFYNAAPASVSTESEGDTGGFLVPAFFHEPMLQPFANGFNFPAHCNRITTPTNSAVAVIDRRPPHDKTGGVNAYLVAEAQPIPQSKVKLEAIQHRLAKLAILLPVTEELVTDAPGLGEHLLSASRAALVYEATYHCIRGTGVGGLGMLNSPALVTAAADAGQMADTITAGNIAGALSRLTAESFPTALALMHPDAHEWILKLVIDGTGPAVTNLYTAGDETAPAGRLGGKPIILSEACSRLGDIGDVIFADPKQYIVMLKDPESRVAMSPHIWWDRDLHAFRVVMRFAGLPAWSNPVQSRDSDNFRSPYTAIAAR